MVQALKNFRKTRTQKRILVVPAIESKWKRVKISKKNKKAGWGHLRGLCVGELFIKLPLRKRLSQPFSLYVDFVPQMIWRPPICQDPTHPHTSTCCINHVAIFLIMIPRPYSWSSFTNWTWALSQSALYIFNLAMQQISTNIICTSKFTHNDSNPGLDDIFTALLIARSYPKSFKSPTRIRPLLQTHFSMSWFHRCQGQCLAHY